MLAHDTPAAVPEYGPLLWVLYAAVALSLLLFVVVPLVRLVVDALRQACAFDEVTRDDAVRDRERVADRCHAIAPTADDYPLVRTTL